jgi:DNA repair photolyase
MSARLVQSTLAGVGSGEVACAKALNLSRLPGLTYALNPYVGCAHACSYCYAQDVLRLGDRGPWGSWVESKRGIASRLSSELRRAKPGTIGLGTVTDPYQPAEAGARVTQACLEVLSTHDHPVCIQTKSDLVLRDIDLVSGLQSPEVGITVTTVDDNLASVLEPGAPSPSSRLSAAAALSKAGVKVWVFLGPVISGVNDSEESVRSVVAGASRAGAAKVIFDHYRHKPLADARTCAALGRPFKRRMRSGDAERVARGACADEGLAFELAF